MLLQEIIQKDSELKKTITPILQYIDFSILGIDRSIVMTLYKNNKELNDNIYKMLI